jgi:putative endonuclease
MTNHARGHEAEKYAAAYLKEQGYKILDMNWRRPRAEIDIIAQKRRGPVTFIEVKYRQSAAQGTGLDYITPRKLAQMQFAAELWVSERAYDGELTLAALEMTGEDYQVSDFIANIS